MVASDDAIVVAVEGLTKVYGAKTPNPVHALQDVSFAVRRGAFAAVMGQSGSGKSTLLNLLGCLDRPTTGRYRLNGEDVSGLRRRQLAHVRARTLGFVFQSFHLLPRLTIQSNCELPLQYLGGVRRRERRRRAAEALARVGLSDKLNRRPTELSGGQQQRVAIARALVNRPALLLADEPTGNLDTRTGYEILELLQELHATGMTVILVTHNPGVSRHTQVTFQLEDGRLAKTETRARPRSASETLAEYMASHPSAEAQKRKRPELMIAAIAMAFQALAANKLRSVLTILGTVIGVACVVALWNIGESSRRYMGGALSSIGQHLIMVRARWDADDASVRRFRYRPLRARQYYAVRDDCPSVAQVSPVLWTSADIVFGGRRKHASIRGCAPSFLTIRGWTIEKGVPFADGDVASSARVVLLGANVTRELFGGLDAVGQTVMIERVPFRVIGVLKAKGSFFGENQDDQVLAPHTALMDHLGRGSDYHMLWISARSKEVIPQARREILLTIRESQQLPADAPDSVSLEDLGEVAASVDKVLVGFSLFLGAVGAVSLLVGGIGIMNIMLVSVTERTREIGLRMALGATDTAILTQFLTEAAVLSSLGGVLGLAIGAGGALGATVILTRLTGSPWPPIISPDSMVAAVVVALGVGVFFGFYPAWRASRLDPIEALRRE